MNTLAEFGIDIPWSATGEVRTDCPRCSPGRGKHHDTCLTVNVEKRVWKCYYCGWHGGLRSDKGSYGFSRAAHPPPQPNERQAVRLRELWQDARAITPDDSAARYLRQRGIMPSTMPENLRFHPQLHYWHAGVRVGTYPTLLAAMRSPTGGLVNIHRTYLTTDGHKADVPGPKKLMTPAIRGATVGAAVQLDPPGETLAVAEGIETALAVRQCTTLPTWATIGTGGMKALIVPDRVRSVIICADHDAPGLKAARVLAKRMLLQGRQVKILTPDTPGMDWADTIERPHDNSIVA